MKKLEAKIRTYTEKIVGSTIGNSWVSPDGLTLTSLGLTFGVVWLLAQGSLFWASLLFLVASSFDMLDGALARSRAQARPFGAFLDSTIDRYSEMLVFFGLLLYYYYYQGSVNPLYMLLIFLASHGSLLTSYVRARAESLNYDGRAGLLERPGRVIVLFLGMLSGWLMPCLIVLAVLSHISALQRVFFVWQQSKHANSDQPLRFSLQKKDKS
ncbi:MAG: CDP-alcohol phosphatidyltransferase family protein [Chloroflexales bacterium]